MQKDTDTDDTHSYTPTHTDTHTHTHTHTHTYGNSRVHDNSQNLTISDQYCLMSDQNTVYVNKMSPYSNSNYLSSTVSIV